MGIYMPNGAIIAGSSKCGQAPNINISYHGKNLIVFYAKFSIFRIFQNFLTLLHIRLYDILQPLYINWINLYINNKIYNYEM